MCLVRPDDGHNFGCEEWSIQMMDIISDVRKFWLPDSISVLLFFFGRVERTSPGQTFSPIEVTNASKRRRQRFRAAGRGSSSLRIGSTFWNSCPSSLTSDMECKAGIQPVMFVSLMWLPSFSGNLHEMTERTLCPCGAKLFQTL